MKHAIDMFFINLLMSFGAIVRNDGITIESLNDELLNLNEQAESIQASADSEGRGLTEDETNRLNDIFAQFESTGEEIERRERISAQREKLASSSGRKTDDKKPKAYREPKARNSGMNGFETFGHFAKAVQAAANPATNKVDPRLIQNAPSTFGNEGSGADGGFMVPADIRTTIQQQVFGDGSIIAMTDQQFTAANNLSIPTDETSPWGSNGIQANWEGEGDQGSQSKLQLKNVAVRLNKLMAIVPITEELSEDTSGLTSYLSSKTPEVFDFKINDALFNGSGAGQPLGILNSGALVTVAKETSQTADTIVFENIVKMWSRMKAKDRKNAVWFINQDIEPQLLTMSFEGSSSSVPAYMPANGLSGSPYGTLMGRPVIPIENAQTLGDAGDIMFVNMAQYLTGQKIGGMRTDTSMHLWFDYDVLAFKFAMRVAGQPWLSAPISPANGANTYSPFVTLAARA